MNVRAHYGKAAMSESGELRLRVPLTEVVEDLAGLATDTAIVQHLARKYGPMAGEQLDASVREWIVDETPAIPVVFLNAMVEAGQDAEGNGGGRLLPALGEPLHRVQYNPDGTADIESGDLPALGAWALAELVRSQRLVRLRCQRCNRDFLTPRGGHATCNRLYRDRETGAWLTKTCRQLDRERGADVARVKYRREYRNIWDRVERGTVPQTVFDLWQDEFASLRRGPRELNEWLSIRSTRRAKHAARLMDEHKIARAQRIAKRREEG